MATISVSTAPSLSLDSVRRLYDRGLYQQAYAAGNPFGRLQDWPGTEGQILAARLADNLGAGRLGSALHFRAWRNDRTHPEACLYYVFTVCNRKGPWFAWNAHRACGKLETASPELQADWLALRGRIAATLRDFESADHWIERAMRSCDNKPWPWVERASILQFQDLYAEALESVQHALQLRPFFRPAIQSAAHLLQLLNRDSEALELLLAACAVLESGDTVLQLAALQTELEMYREAHDSLERAAALLTFKDKKYQEFIAARLSDTAYHCGDYAECLRWSKQVDQPFFKAIAERLSSAPATAKRVRLPVGFVRQHHMTCAPATLSALSSFWNMQVQHLEIADKICYDGTPSHSQRLWAQQNGFLAREFTVTWETTVNLIDRGIPFTITTVEPGNAHLQAVIGYDARRGTLLIRDPTHRSFGEGLAKEMMERYAPSGPRGMVMVPQAKANLLLDLELPEASLYDGLFRLEMALQAHDRKAALEELTKLQAEAPDHRLTILARCVLANYDGNILTLLEATEAQLKLFPNDFRAKLSQLSLLTQLARREDRLKQLNEISAKPDADPIFWLHQVREYIDDGREHQNLKRRLRKIIRFRPQMAEAYHDLARIEWNQCNREGGVELFRFAACLEDKDERHAHSFFVSMRQVGRAAQALEMLVARFNRFGRHSNRPARTLCWALDELAQGHESLKIIDTALVWRPDDGELLLYAVDFFGRRGKIEKATALLEQAANHSNRGAWRRQAATLAIYRGDTKTAHREYQAIVSEDPLAIDSQRTYTQLVADMEGISTALEHLHALVNRFPYHYWLNQLLIEWLREYQPEKLLDSLLRMLESFPNDAWARRELATVYTRRLEFASALCEANVAKELEVGSSWTWSILGHVQAQAGQLQEARNALQQAIHLSVDNDSAIAQLLQLSHTAADRLNTIVFVYEELCKQITLGNALLTWRERASEILDGITLLHVLMEALQARPDLWQAWSAVIQQLSELNHLERAAQVSAEATNRFPLLPKLWLDFADVCRRRFDVAGQRAALDQALQINPRWSVAVQQLAETYDREHNYEKSLQLLETLLAHSPLDATNHGWYAGILWRLNRKQEAIEHLKRAVQLNPGYDWAWVSLAQWGTQAGQPRIAQDVAQELTNQRPGEARSWLFLARSQAAAGDADTALNTLQHVIELNPRSVAAFDLSAELLVRTNRYEEALAACNPPAFAGAPPVELRGRSAWIHARRGQVPKAIVAMEQLLAESPGYLSGWEMLAEWYERAKRWSDYRNVSERLVQLAPFHSIGYGHRGAARLRDGDRQGAKADWTRAIQIDPAYLYGGLSLTDLQLENGELDAAAAVLQSLKQHAPGDLVTAREVRLACRYGDREFAKGLLTELCGSSAGNAWAIRTAAQEYTKSFGQAAMLAVLSEHYNQPTANPEIIVIMIEAYISRGAFGKCRRTLKKLKSMPTVWERGAVAYLQALARLKKRHSAWWFIKRNWFRLRAQTWVWGAVAESLSNVNLRRQVLQWCSDWRERKNVTPRMIFFVAINARLRFRFQVAKDAQKYALGLIPDGWDHTHRLLTLLDDCAVHGMPQDASKVLAEVNPDYLGNFYRDLRALAKTYLEIMSPPKLANDGYFSAATQMEQALGKSLKSFRHMASFRKLWHQLLAQLAASRGKPLLTSWHNFRDRYFY